MANGTRLLTFLAGVETFDALTHAYLSMTRTSVPHPAELLGIKVTPKFHAVAAIVNGAIAAGLGARALTTRA
ncbi:MAG: hypothetical protein K2X03_31050 [Bryobacteraceae bacterium]|nr:hypothetical protein [Bryobacteraceae bacterium]